MIKTPLPDGRGEIGSAIVTWLQDSHDEEAA